MVASLTQQRTEAPGRLRDKAPEQRTTADQHRGKRRTRAEAGLGLTVSRRGDVQRSVRCSGVSLPRVRDARDATTREMRVHPRAGARPSFCFRRLPGACLDHARATRGIPCSQRDTAPPATDVEIANLESGQWTAEMQEVQEGICPLCENQCEDWDGSIAVGMDFLKMPCEHNHVFHAGCLTGAYVAYSNTLDGTLTHCAHAVQSA